MAVLNTKSPPGLRRNSLPRPLMWPGLFNSSSPPSLPCAPERSCFNAGGCHRQSYSRSTHRTHTMLPALHSLPRSFPLHMSRQKSLIGRHVVVRARENVTYITHTLATCQWHHRHVTARHSRRLMLHYSPRCWLCCSGSIVSPCRHGQVWP